VCQSTALIRGEWFVLEAKLGSTVGCGCSSTCAMEFSLGKFVNALDGSTAKLFTGRVAAGGCAGAD
jgi:hypothetical protein